MLNFDSVYQTAHEFGMAAAAACHPIPMVVQEHANMADDRSPVVKQWYVADGVCGFAWIQFPGNTAWGKWAKAKGIARKAYPTGLSIWVHQFNQSMQKKEAYARAFARYLNAVGIKAHSGSRMD